MSEIYIPGHCKVYYDDGSHHEKCMVPIDEAITIMSNEWVEDGNYCEQTIIDMRDGLKSQAERIKELEEAMRDFTETLEKAGDYHEQNAVALNFYMKFKKILGD